MALGDNIQYTPFQETSFGYGSGEIAALTDPQTQTPLFPNATDIVRVYIDVVGHVDDTGHISTPTVGTAVPVYNSDTHRWDVRGERDDVDAVLAQLSFFPSDYPSTRNWTPTSLKDNQTTGVYTNEEPPEIPDTDMSLNIYDANDNFLSGHTVTWEATY